MRIVNSSLAGCYIIEPEVFKDSRGLFYESFNKKKYKKIIDPKYEFVQDNFSYSSKGVLRGLHMQINKPQGKLVKVTHGEVFDVAVDLRKDSNTFGKWTGVYLSDLNKKQFWIPPGFAHGFLALTDGVNFEYKCTDFYYPDDEVTIIWNDSKLNIDWPSQYPIVSDKDKKGITLDEFLGC